MMWNFFMAAILAALNAGCGGDKSTSLVGAKETATYYEVSDTVVTGYSNAMDKVWSFSVDGIISSHVVAEVNGDSVVVVGVGNSSIHTDSGRIIGLRISDGQQVLDINLNNIRRPENVASFDNFRVDVMDIADGMLAVAASDVKYYVSMVTTIDLKSGGVTTGIFWNPGTLQYLSAYTTDGKRKIVAGGFNNDIGRIFAKIGISGEAPSAVFFQLDVSSMTGESQAPPAVMSDSIPRNWDWYYIIPGSRVTRLEMEKENILVGVEGKKTGEEVPLVPLMNQPPSVVEVFLTVKPDGLIYPYDGQYVEIYRF